MINKYFYEVFENIPRQGPGSIEETQKAYSLLKNLPEKPSILDVGCGKGIQTVELAKLSNGFIVALDNYLQLLQSLEKNLKEAGIVKNYKLVLDDMAKMPFGDEEFDIIWSEGAIFVIGVPEGISKWKKFIKKGGYLVYTECCWLKPNPPEELIQFWKEEYPGMLTIEDNIVIAKQNGLELVHHFTLSVPAWKNNFYDFIELKVDELSKKYARNAEAMATFDYILNEIRVFDKFHDYYGYEFFIFKK